MRYAIASILAVSSLIAFALAWHTSHSFAALELQSLIAYQAPTVPEDFQRSFTYPLKFPAPGEPEFDTDDGPSTYLDWYQYGWDDCLATFYHDVRYENDPMWQTTRTEWITVGAPDHRNAARIDGWFDCATQLRSQLKLKTEDTLRISLRNHLASIQRPYAISYAVIGGILLLIASGLLFLRDTKKSRPKS